MGDLVSSHDLVSGFIGVVLDKVITQILHHISIAVRYRKELESLENLVISIQPMITQIQQYRSALNRNNGIRTSQCFNKASAVSRWLRKLDVLLRQALEVVQRCAIPKYKVFFRYKSSRMITRLISDIRGHLDLSPLVQLAQIPELAEELKHTIKESVEAAFASSSSSSSATTSHPLASGGVYISEPLIVGQEKAFARLEKLVTDAECSRIGVIGMGGSGKTLLFRRVFNSKVVQNIFSDGLLLWLTVSHSPSFTSLRNDLCSQISMQTKADPVKDMNEETVKVWLNENMQAKRFALFLDDLWGEGAKLLEELGVVGHLIRPSTSKIIVSSRDQRVLLEMGVNAETSAIKMEDLIEDQSWRLFTNHAFPYNDGNPPASVDERTARLVCAKCGGLPLAIKAVGRAMAGIADGREWELAVLRLPNANSQERQAVYDRLRLSYDVLGRYDVNLQMCFLCLAAAFSEDQIVDAEFQALPLLLGEGLLGRKKPQDLPDHNPFEMGRIYLKLLADRCLIEPTVRGVDGRVLCFRMHDVLRELGIQIAEREENFYSRVGQRLTALDENECSGCTRIWLSDNELSSLPNSLKGQEICSLLIDRNSKIREIPNKVMGSMISLTSLDLTGTSLQSLPESVGCLKQLVCLSLGRVPMTKLPASVTNLVSLEFLDVRASKIRELPDDIDKLTSLKYMRLSGCKDLQYLPRSFSRLPSLQLLEMFDCTALWTKNDQKKSWKRMASIGDLGGLAQLKSLRVENNGERIGEGIFGRMLQMETLRLKLTMTESLPDDMISMSKLRSLNLLDCYDVVKMGSNFCEFQNLSRLQLWGCRKLEELPYLNKLRCLKQLEIVACPMLKRFPKEFGEMGAFPLLEIFSLIYLDELEELPVLKEGTMPSLKILTLIVCKVLNMHWENYLSLKKLQKVRVYGCPLVLENLKQVNKEKIKVEVVTLSLPETISYLDQYDQEIQEWVDGELWRNELCLFMQALGRFM